MLVTILLLLPFLINCIFAFDHGEVHHEHHLHCDYEEHLTTISTPWGKVKGSTINSRLNKTIYAFRGIKYANAERFKDPVMVPKWDGVYNATYDRPYCPQPTPDPTSEDCLHLNVYTKILPGENSKHPKHPVIVYLYPGAFYAGASHSDWVGPQYLLDTDIVLVTLNNRLGALGFISTGTKDATGNYGLKDQVVAIKWVKKNIAAFGGDPDSITLYGYSAGAWSISLHMVSPMIRGKGLFHKGILGSGSALGHYPLPKHQLYLAQRQARILGCPDDTPANIIKCLKTKPAEDLGNSLAQMFEFGDSPILLWCPVIEDDLGQERYLTENPVEMYRRGDFDKIPVMAGVTHDETGDRMFRVLANETLANWLNTDFEKYGPLNFIYESNTEKSKEVSRAIRKFYLNDQPITNDSLTGLAKLAADSIVGYPAYRTVNLIAQNNPQPVFYYKLAYKGRYSFFYLPNSNNTPWGVVHHDDLIYLFYISRMFPFFGPTYPEAKITGKLTTMWSNFAKTGNPIPTKTSDLDNALWPPYNQRTRKYMNIGEKLVIKEKMFQDRYSFWESLYPIN